MDLKRITHKVLLSFWKVHVLHHAAKGEVIGNWMLEALRHHGHVVSPGTLYPMLKRMERHGWLTSTVDSARGPKAPRSYKITKEGRAACRARCQLALAFAACGKCSMPFKTSPTPPMRACSKP